MHENSREANRHALSRTVRRFERLSGYPALVERVRVLTRPDTSPGHRRDAECRGLASPETLSVLHAPRGP